ncbi:MAG: cytochrome b5-like heme/steroid binding domain-containing protein [Patescibacteria group bacterium]|nr:MAG: cytochrome b5-like heme/steroid binding domain-containing protein [Patescibacteria group bacterium]
MKKILLSFASVLILVGAGCASTTTLPPAAQEQPAPAPTPEPAPEPTPTPEPPCCPPPETETEPEPTPPVSDEPTGAKTYTMAEVAAHAGAASCWSAINGSVYDLTSWIGKHPGGESAILSLCGRDGSATFNNQHGGSALQENRLASFKIGALK